MSAVYEDGEMVGVQIDGIRDGGLYDRIGLRNGDVVTEINGVSLADPGADGEGGRRQPPPTPRDQASP